MFFSFFVGYVIFIYYLCTLKSLYFTNSTIRFKIYD